MKKFTLFLTIGLLTGLALRAQDKPAGMVAVDSIVYRPSAVSDASLEGKSIFSVLTGEAKGVTISQDPSIVTAMNSHISYNRRKKYTGYRVRIFFDNKQDSRGASEAAMRRFQGAFPGYSAYRSFTSPHFKVTVGDFRTKSEAVQLLSRVKGMFPSAFIVKEQINYPSADRRSAFVTDTVQVYRPAAK
ncbi:MAG: SPOR domain-containing protein [Bacteroidales bacterium]|nr:SPOR domain-containing protein [Bacteroidales bacterium]